MSDYGDDWKQVITVWCLFFSIPSSISIRQVRSMFEYDITFHSDFFIFINITKASAISAVAIEFQIQSYKSRVQP